MVTTTAARKAELLWSTERCVRWRYGGVDDGVPRAADFDRLVLDLQFGKLGEISALATMPRERQGPPGQSHKAAPAGHQAA